MGDVTLALSDEEWRALHAAAERAGMTVEAFAMGAVSAAVQARYRLPAVAGDVVTFEGLNRDRRKTE